MLSSTSKWKVLNGNGIRMHDAHCFSCCLWELETQKYTSCTFYDYTANVLGDVTEYSTQRQQGKERHSVVKHLSGCTIFPTPEISAVKLTHLMCHSWAGRYNRRLRRVFWAALIFRRTQPGYSRRASTELNIKTGLNQAKTDA